MRQFPLAAHPEIMRAAQKDEQYVSDLSEACRDAFRRFFGTRLTVAYEHEIKLGGQALYYFLTTGLGVQTLGEEYGNITQVAGESGLPLNPARRTSLVLLQTVIPYLAERLSSRAAARGMLLANQSTLVLESSNMDVQSLEAPGSHSVHDEPGSHLNLLQWLRKLWPIALQRWPVVLPSMKEALLLMVRANLMLFYFDGIYYHIAKRVAGVKYAYMGKPPPQRIRYHMLGIFLLIQLCITGSTWLHQNVIPVLSTSMRSHLMVQSAMQTGWKGAQVLDEDSNPINEKYMLYESQVKLVAENVVSSKCTLCLSPRQCPTATPCGHVFCWYCVAEWCNEKLECPLCRSPMTHSQLVPIYNADF